MCPGSTPAASKDLLVLDDRRQGGLREQGQGHFGGARHGCRGVPVLGAPRPGLAHAALRGGAVLARGPLALAVASASRAVPLRGLGQRLRSLLLRGVRTGILRRSTDAEADVACVVGLPERLQCPVGGQQRAPMALDGAEGAGLQGPLHGSGLPHRCLRDGLPRPADAGRQGVAVALEGQAPLEGEAHAPSVGRHRLGGDPLPLHELVHAGLGGRRLAGREPSSPLIRQRRSHGRARRRRAPKVLELVLRAPFVVAGGFDPRRPPQQHAERGLGLAMGHAVGAVARLAALREPALPQGV
mmetsp:Transcript_47420/g.152245  ORF Transcript_47420/g.152245 Transcript_47420/m.152245 type:complete len:299 (+) Transcript_47420:93-989(+)